MSPKDRSAEIGRVLDNTFLYANVDTVFPSLTPDLGTLQALLAPLPRAETMFFCTRCNAILTGFGSGDIQQRQQRLVGMLLGREDIDRVNYIAAQSKKRVLPFFRGQMLDLMRWAALFCAGTNDDFTVFDAPQSRRDFAAAAFIAGELSARRLGERNLVVPHDRELFPETTLAYSIGAVYSTASLPHTWTILGRGLEILREYYPKHDPCLDERLRSAIGLNLEEYMICLLSLVPAFSWDRQGGTFMNLLEMGEVAEFREQFRLFIQAESQTTDELACSFRELSPGDDPTSWNWSLDPLRARPILAETWERAVLVDGRLWEEKSSVGALFHAIRDRDRDEARAVLGAFGKAFEDYACDILETLVAPESERLEWQFQRRRGRNTSSEGEFEIDATYLDGRQLFLFEIKASFLREDRMHDPEGFLEHLDEKYVRRRAKKAGTHRAVEQLSRVCRLISSREWLGDDEEFSDVVLLHPVLVVYDSLLSAPLIGEYLAKRFREQISPDEVLASGQMKKQKIRIAALTILTADDIENLESSVKHFKFTRLLWEYEYECPSRVVSLHDYIARSRFVDMLEPNERLVESGRSGLREVVLRAFGREVPEDPAKGL